MIRPEQILPVLEADAGGAKPVPERMPKIMHANLRQVRTPSGAPPRMMVDALQRLAGIRED